MDKWENNKSNMLDDFDTSGFIQPKLEMYTKFDFEREVFGMNVIELIELLDYKKNIILQGAPGVGKTYTARRLAWAMMGFKDDSRIVQVQFHQNYGYEDFVMGLKPALGGGFKLDYGPFYKLCKKAANDKEHKDYYLIIDEINRGNLSKILGEGFSLIEKNHRNEKITMKYNSELFSIPDNLYIIGTMNTADRGLVMLDYALRRRFAFYTIEPQYKSNGFRQLMMRSNNIKLNKLARKILDLNKAISADSMLGPGFQIGHSYFCLGREITDKDLEHIVKYEIEPLLDEYWYDSEDNLKHWKSQLEAIINN